MLALKSHLKKVAVTAILASVVAVPFAVRASAQHNSQEPVTTPVTQPIGVVDQFAPTETTPVVAADTTPAPATSVAVVADVVEPTETDPTAPVPAQDLTIDAALAIARAEHPGVDIVLARAKTLKGVAVYKFAFKDGFRLYVRASDGTVVTIKDKDDKSHECSHRSDGVVNSERRKNYNKWHHKKDSSDDDTSSSSSTNSGDDSPETEVHASSSHN